MIIPDGNTPLRKGNAPTPPAYNNHWSTSRYIPIPTEDFATPRTCPEGASSKHSWLLSSFGPSSTDAMVVNDVNMSTIKDGISSPAYEDGDIDDCVLWVSASDRARSRLPRFHSGHWSRRDSLCFSITIELLSKHNAIRRYPAFGAELPKFAVHIKDLSTLRFGGVSLQSTDSSIEITGLVAKELLLRATNSAVGGVFNTSDTFTIETTIAPVSLGKVTKVFVKRINRHIEADLPLVASSKSGTGAVYAFLDTAYEGAFSMETTYATPVLDPRGTLKIFQALDADGAWRRS
ncbi:hypothetical protein BC834DRAFT_844646 [Gloeopeniophorella convolvens]|nr:hypothetical protein BC834DRAFT_844646 [Gloeopeniophorella convolvens]